MCQQVKSSGHYRTAILVAALTIAASPVAATPPVNFSATQQWKGVFDEMDVHIKAGKSERWQVKLQTKQASDVHVVRNVIGAGGQSGWHRHPGPSLITVTVGEIVAYDSTDPLCTPKRYVAGQGFIDLGDHAHLLRNETSALAETVAVQFLPVGSSRRIDVDPAPNNCTF